MFFAGGVRRHARGTSGALLVALVVLVVVIMWQDKREQFRVCKICLNKRE